MEQKVYFSTEVHMPILKYFLWSIWIVALLSGMIEIAQGIFPQGSLILLASWVVFSMGHPSLHVLHDRVRHGALVGEASIDIYFHDIETVLTDQKKIVFILKNGNTKSYRVQDAAGLLKAIETQGKEYFPSITTDAESPNIKKITSLPDIVPDENGILYDAVISKGKLGKFLKTAFFGLVEIIILFIWITTVQKYFGFQSYNAIEYLLLWYLVIRCGLVLLSENTFRIVITTDELRYYYQKKKGRKQKILVIPKKHIVKVAGELRMSVDIMYMQGVEKKKLQISVNKDYEVSKLQEISILLQKK